MRTTININSLLLLELKESARKLDITTNELIEILLRKAFSQNRLKAVAFSGIKYQERDPGKKWKRHHVRFEYHMYEHCLDFRKFMKISVSLLIAYAIANYLNEITIINIEEVDNYPCNYLFIANTFNMVNGFMVFWGIPEEKYLSHLLP
jgi:hypothetical protein